MAKWLWRKRGGNVRFHDEPIRESHLGPISGPGLPERRASACSGPPGGSLPSPLHLCRHPAAIPGNYILPGPLHVTNQEKVLFSRRQMCDSFAWFGCFIRNSTSAFRCISMFGFTFKQDSGNENSRSKVSRGANCPSFFMLEE